MQNYYEALPMSRVAMDVAALRVEAVVQRYAMGNKHSLDGCPREMTLDAILLRRFVEIFGNASRFGLRERKVGASSGTAARLVERALACGLTVRAAFEEPEPCGRIKRRRIACLFERPSEAEAGKEESI